MACSSVAVTSAQIAQVILDETQLRDAFAKVLGVDPAVISYSEWGTRQFVRYRDSSRNMTISWAQVDGSLALTVAGDGIFTNSAAVQAYAKELETKAAGAAVVAQQRAILKRLAALGKLSNVQQKDTGVVARLEITI